MAGHHRAANSENSLFAASLHISSPAQHASRIGHFPRWRRGLRGVCCLHRKGIWAETRRRTRRRRAMATTERAVIERFVAALAARDRAAATALYAPDALFEAHVPGWDPIVEGPAEIGELLDDFF